jgi:hypothetical protein
MDAYGGNDEESAELRKLLAEVVRSDSVVRQHEYSADRFVPE